MKKIIFSLALCIFAGANVSYAQATSELWGVTSFGGDGYGVVYKTDANGDNQIISSALRSVYSVNAPAYGKLCEVNGLLYGVSEGGVNNRGLIYSYDPATNAVVQLALFNETNGSSPQFGLTKATNGKLYGVCSNGGTYGLGVLYEFDVATNTITVRHHFAGNNGSAPMCKLVQASDGKLYGNTMSGGANNDGVIFQFDPTTNVYQVKITLNIATKGAAPFSGMVSANGKLYGMTSQGGTYGYGTLYEYNFTSNIFTKKMAFNGSNGAHPYGGMTLGTDGILYGTTTMGGADDYGVIFEYDPVGNVYTKTVDLDWSTTGIYPKGSMTLTSGNIMYGLMSEGGTGGVGVLFEYNPAVNGFDKKVDFTSSTQGGYPMGSLSLGSDNKLYGFASSGGEHGIGTLFNYEIATEDFVAEVHFDAGADGSQPRGAMVLGSNGKLYTTCSYGGEFARGTLIEIDPALNGGALTKLVDFSDTATGRYPRGALLQHSNGKLYGTSSAGGANGDGVLFEYDYNTNTFTKKVDFAAAGGSSPAGELAEGPGGKIYGVTTVGGIANRGVLYEYDPSTNVYTKLFDFIDATTGFYPGGGVTLHSNGKLYGVVGTVDASHPGAIFEYTISTATYAKLFDFGTVNGTNPQGGLTEAPNGKLYGVAMYGGVYDFGVIFEFDPSTNTYTKKYDFPGGAGGQEPMGCLTLSPNGKLYGCAFHNGPGSPGFMYEYKYTTNTLTQKIVFTYPNGGSSYGGRMAVVCESVNYTVQPDVIPLCVGAALALNSGSSSGTYSYQWYHDSTPISGATASTYSVTAVALADSGNYYCQITNSCRTANTEPTRVRIDSVHVLAPPSPGTISGPNDVCPITGTLMVATYSVASAGGNVLYNWVIPSGATLVSGQGTDSIQVKFPSTYTSGTVKVQSYYTCGGSSAFSTLTVSKTTAGTPTTINGPKSNLCPNVNYTYTTPAVANAVSYTWTVPAYCTIVSGQGTSSLTVKYTTSFVSGSLSVKSVNHCSSSAVRSVTITKKPTTPGAITGTKNVCANLGGAPLTYSIAAIAGVTSYTWTVPSGCTIVAGQGTTSISVSYPNTFTTGNISVVCVGTCVNSTASSIAVTYAPLQPAGITGDATVCSQITSSTPITYSIAAVSGATGYNWIVPMGATIQSGQGTRFLTVLFDSALVAGTQIKVAAVNGCTTGPYRLLAVTGCSAAPRLIEPAAVDSSLLITLYPNPTSDVLNISIPSDCNSEVDIELYDLSGNLIRAERQTITEGVNTATIDVAELSSGLYFIRVIDVSGAFGEMNPFIKE